MSKTTVLTAKIDAAYASGDESALWEAVNTLALGISKHDQDAAQEMTIAVWSGLHHYKGESRISTWIVGVLKTTYFLYLRESTRNHISKDAALLDSPKTVEESNVWFPCEVSERVFTLKAGGMSYKEIAELLGYNYPTLKNAVSRWKKKIRTHYERLGITF